MFLDELTPFLQELTRQPVAFLGGFVSGALRLNLDDDPVKSWLGKQNVEVSNDDDFGDGGTGSSPQQISID
ncbi:MAG: hypothetical protein AAF773_18480 [Cyanobacteria bacterium P01_D01_bin.115]